MNLLACKWLKAAHELPYDSPEHSAAYDAHTTACPPQHDDENTACPHNTAAGNICTCELEDNLGWELKWSRNPRRYTAGKNPDGTKYPGGFRWSDDEDNYDILQADGDDEFVLVCCDGTHIGTTKTLEDARALAQREYAGIQILFHGSREDN